MRFFAEGPFGETLTLCGEDAKHIAKVLRLSKGDEITLCDMRGNDYRAMIQSAQPDSVIVRVSEQTSSKGEPHLRVRLYQALPKADKMELIVQKAVELGVSEIVPVLTARCVSKPDKGSMPKKIERWQRIAYEAAKQSRRGIIPQVLPLQNFADAVKEMADGSALVLYENSTLPLSAALKNFHECTALSLMSGTEGGFEPEEIALAKHHGIADISLGTRILRCETAPLAVLSAVMYQFGEF